MCHREETTTPRETEGSSFTAAQDTLASELCRRFSVEPSSSDDLRGDFIRLGRMDKGKKSTLVTPSVGRLTQTSRGLGGGRSEPFE